MGETGARSDYVDAAGQLETHSPCAATASGSRRGQRFQLGAPISRAHKKPPLATLTGTDPPALYPDNWNLTADW